jgi:hypothetical protein
VFNVADMLTGVTVPSERRIAQGFEQSFHRSAEAIRHACLQSDIHRDMRERQNYPPSEIAAYNTEQFIASVKLARHKSLPSHSPLMVPILSQVIILVKRQFWQIWGDKLQLYLRQGNTIVQALIMGSLFYDMPINSTGLFLRGGTLFFSTLYHT